MKNKGRETFRTVIKNVLPVLREDGLFETTRVIQSRQTGAFYYVEQVKRPINRACVPVSFPGETAFNPNIQSV